MLKAVLLCALPVLSAAELLSGSYPEAETSVSEVAEAGEDVIVNEDMESYSTASYGGSPVTRVRNILLEKIYDLIKHEEYPGDTVGVLVRLAFHDAGTYNKYTGKGGADACIAVPCYGRNECEYSADYNRGLPFIVDHLNRLYDSEYLNKVLSRADFFHFASFLAVKVATPGEWNDFHFRFGRKDCEYSKPKFAPAPDAEQDHWDYYWAQFNRMGFSAEEMIALIGAHTLGRLDKRYSGYDGPWVDTTATLDNEYYVELYNYPWNRIQHSAFDGKIRHYWRSPVNGHKMLNADMALFWDIYDKRCVVPGRQGSSSYTGVQVYSGYQRNNYCREISESWKLLELYARDNDAWIRHFNQAFQKLQELGMGYEHNYGSDYDHQNQYHSSGYSTSYGSNYGNYGKSGYQQTYKPSTYQTYKPSTYQTYRPSTYQQTYRPSTYQQTYKPSAYQQTYKPSTYQQTAYKAPTYSTAYKGSSYSTYKAPSYNTNTYGR